MILNKFLRYKVHLVLFALAFSVYASSDFTLFDSDTRHYFIGARNLLQEQTYFIGGKPGVYPMGFSLLIIPFFLIFGISVQSAGYTVAFLGAMSAAVLYELGRDLFEKKTAVFAALFLIFSKFWEMSTVLMSDVPAVFFMLFGLFLFRKYLENGRAAYLYFFFFSAGTACLIRYQSVLLFPLVGLYLLLSNKGRILKQKEIYLGSIISLGVLSPQILFNIIHFGNPLRGAYGDKLGMPFSFQFQYPYFKHILTGLGTPIFPLLICGFWILYRQGKRDELSFLFSWLAVPVIPFLFTYNCLMRYILFVLPAMLLASGYGLSRLHEKYLLKSKARNRLFFLLLVLLLLIPTVLFRWEKIQRRDNRFECRKKMNAWIAEHTERDAVVLSMWGWPDFFYTKRKLTQIPSSAAGLKALISSKPRSYFVMSEPWELQDVGDSLIEVKRYLNNRYGLTLIKSIETEISLSPFSQFMHEIITKTGYYSSKKSIRWHVEKERWEIYLIDSSL